MGSDVRTRNLMVLDSKGGILVPSCSAHSFLATSQAHRNSVPILILGVFTMASLPGCMAPRD